MLVPPSAALGWPRAGTSSVDERERCRSSPSSRCSRRHRGPSMSSRASGRSPHAVLRGGDRPEARRLAREDGRCPHRRDRNGAPRRGSGEGVEVGFGPRRWRGGITREHQPHLRFEAAGSPPIYLLAAFSELAHHGRMGGNARAESDARELVANGFLRDQRRAPRGRERRGRLGRPSLGQCDRGAATRRRRVTGPERSHHRRSGDERACRARRRRRGAWHARGATSARAGDVGVRWRGAPGSSRSTGA